VVWSGSQAWTSAFIAAADVVDTRCAFVHNAVHSLPTIRLDVDRDGDQDLLVLIAGDPSSIPDGTTSVTLTGELDDGTPIAGGDTICTSTTPTNRRAMPG
jgi:hypothetical protein